MRECFQNNHSLRQFIALFCGSSWPSETARIHSWPSFCDFSYRILRETQAIFTLYGIVFRVADTSKLSSIVWTPIRFVTLQFRDPVRAAQPHFVTEIASKAPLSCVKRSPIRYDFSASAKLSSIVSLLSIILTVIIWSYLCYGVNELRKFSNQSEVP